MYLHGNEDNEKDTTDKTHLPTLLSVFVMSEKTSCPHPFKNNGEGKTRLFWCMNKNYTI